MEPRQKVQSITSCYLKLRLLVFKIEMHVILKTEVERFVLNGAVSLHSILSFSVGGSAWQSRHFEAALPACCLSGCKPDHEFSDSLGANVLSYLPKV